MARLVPSTVCKPRSLPAARLVQTITRILGPGMTINSIETNRKERSADVSMGLVSIANAANKGVPLAASHLVYRYGYFAEK